MPRPATEKFPGPDRARRLAGYALAAFLGLVAWRYLDDLANSRLFVVNRTPSLPNWAFVVRRGLVPERGDVVFFLPPRNALVISHFGAAPPPFGKYAYGVPGDIVEREGDRVFVRARDTGRRTEVARLKPRTMRGEPLTAGPTGVIPKGCYYMGSPHKDGFDSRYAAIGFICSRQLIGAATSVIL